MSVILWTFLGVVSGYTVSTIVNGWGQRPAMDMILGVLGAFAGGLMLHLAFPAAATGFTSWSVFVSAIGAAAVLSAYHIVLFRQSHTLVHLRSVAPTTTRRRAAMRRAHR